jgi:hypothetical protein
MDRVASEQDWPAVYAKQTRLVILKLVRAGSSPVYQGSKVQQFKGLTTFIWKM